MSKYNCSYTTKVSSDNVYYAGAYLSTLDISPNEYLTNILQKINDYSFNTSGCVTCDGGVPVFTGVKNAFALATDSNGKVSTATNVYNKTEVNNLISAGNTNIGNTDLTLTSERILDGGGFNLHIQNTPSTSIEASTQILLKAATVVLRTTTDPYFILRLNNNFGTNLDLSLNTQIRNLKTPDEDGIISTQAYVDKSKSTQLTTDNTASSFNVSLSGKDLLCLITSGITLEKGEHFNKNLNDPFITMIFPNTLIINHIYTPIFG